jgi:hypothetical protein
MDKVEQRILLKNLRVKNFDYAKLSLGSCPHEPFPFCSIKIHPVRGDTNQGEGHPQWCKLINGNMKPAKTHAILNEGNR